MEKKKNPLPALKAYREGLTWISTQERVAFV